MPPRLFSALPAREEIAGVALQLDDTLDVEARDQQLAGSFGNLRSLQVGVCEAGRVVQLFAELDRCVSVRSGRVPVALTAVAAGAPAEDVDSQAVAESRRLFAEAQRDRQELDRIRDRAGLETAAAELVEHFGTVGVVADRRFCERAGALQLHDRLVEIAHRHPRPGFVQLCTELGARRSPLELGNAVDEDIDRELVVVCGQSRFGRGKHR